MMYIKVPYNYCHAFMAKTLAGEIRDGEHVSPWQPTKQAMLISVGRCVELLERRHLIQEGTCSSDSLCLTRTV